MAKLTAERVEELGMRATAAASSFVDANPWAADLAGVAIDCARQSAPHFRSAFACFQPLNDEVAAHIPRLMSLGMKGGLLGNLIG